MKRTIASATASLAMAACHAPSSMPPPRPASQAEQLQKLTEAEAALPQEVRKKLAELRRQSEALPRPSRLDVATIRSIKDEDLDFALTWYFGERMRLTGASREAVLRDEPHAFQAFYLSWLLEAEVLNGGFHQYFWNVSPELVGRTAQALQEVGAMDAKEVFVLAVKQAEAEASMRREHKAKGTLQAFSDSYKSSRLQEHDQRFAALANALAVKRAAYVRTHEDKLAERRQ